MMFSFFIKIKNKEKNTNKQVQKIDDFFPLNLIMYTNKIIKPPKYNKQIKSLLKKLNHKKIEKLTKINQIKEKMTF